MSTALVLFSGGLDSILAARLLMEQGVRVVALKFITPFFDHHILARREAWRKEVLEKWGIDAEPVDLSQGYIDLLRHPAHGFGKNFNPCIDCKILMLRRARDLMEHYRADFLATGEVLGQRPMSQRRDTLRIIERDSGCEGLLLRPLCALRLPPTPMEESGLVDRERLLGLTGRGRKPQFALAEHFGITDFPSPAGGCTLTDPILGQRIARLYAGDLPLSPESLRASDIRALLTGRQFRLPTGHWFILGRNQAENPRVAALAREDDWLVRLDGMPGPTGLLRGLEEDPALSEAARLAGAVTARYGRGGRESGCQRQVALQRGEERVVVTVRAATPGDCTGWLF